MTRAVVPAARPSLSAALSDRWLLVLMALGLSMRVALAVGLDGQMLLRADESIYTQMARRLIETGRLETGPFVRPPLYFYFLAAARVLSDTLPISWPLVAKLLQCLAATATTVPIYRAASRVSGKRVARIASAIFLFDPTLIAYTHLLWPETLFLFAVAIVFDAASEFERRSRVYIVSMGVVAGAAMLLKPVFGLFAAVLALDWLRRDGWRIAVRRALLFGIAAAVVIGPWVVRNQLRYGPTILLENQGPYNLWSGNAKDPTQVFREWRELPDPVTRSRVAAQRATAAISSDPIGFAENAAIRALNLWGFEYFVIRHAVNGGYGSVSRQTFLLGFWVIQIGWAVLLLLAVLGTGPVARDPTLRVVVIYTLVFTVLVAAMVTTTRFRVPFAFWLSIAAAIGVDRLAGRRLGGRDLVLVGVAIAVLALSLSRPLFWTIATGAFGEPVELSRPDWNFFRY